MGGLPGRLRPTAPLVIAPLEPLGEHLQQPVEGVGLRLLAQTLVRVRARARARVRARVRVSSVCGSSPRHWSALGLSLGLGLGLGFGLGLP